jgi:methionyl-tRNA formyltransferase
LGNETETSVTLFCFDEGMDTGDIIGQKQFSGELKNKIAEVLQKAEDTTINLVSKYTLNLLNGTAQYQIQDHSKASYASLRRPEDCRIDWQKPAHEIYNFIRAQTHPYPGAFTTLPDGKIIRIWDASIFPYHYHGIPGLVGQKDGQGVVVTCGQDAFVINACSLDKQKTIHPSSVLKWGMKLG